jgi:hypothetical protein
MMFTQQQASCDEFGRQREHGSRAREGPEFEACELDMAA